MGRKKIVIERKPTKALRQLCYSKRNKGLLKKVYELAVLCDVDIGLIMYSPSGVLHHFSTTAPNAAKVLQGMVQHIRDMPEKDKTQVQNITQEIVNSINITAAQDDVADQPGLDAAIREEIKRKNTELRLLQETKRMVKPCMETLISLPASEELERCLQTRLNKIIELKRQFLVQQRQGGIEARNQVPPQGVQMQELGVPVEGMRELLQLPMQQLQGVTEARNWGPLLRGVLKQEQGIPLVGMSEQLQLPMQQPQEGTGARNWGSPLGGNHQLQHQVVPAIRMEYPSSSSVQVQPQAGRFWDLPNGGGRQLQHQQVVSVSAVGMGYPSTSSSSMQEQSGEDASHEADMEMDEAVPEALFNPQESRRSF